jgi:hypothetical protein
MNKGITVIHPSDLFKLKPAACIPVTIVDYNTGNLRRTVYNYKLQAGL